MVVATNDSFDTLFSALEKKYKNCVSAAALFWRRYRGGNNYQYGLRIESPSIMKEFVDNVNLGTDPEGFLFFNSVDDLDGGNGKYNVLHNTTNDTNQRAALVQFFHGAQGHFYAEFLAKDPNKTVDYLVDSQSGHWLTLNIGSASAHVKKYSDTSSVVVTLTAIKKKITFDVPGNQGSASVDVWGNVMFKDITKLKASTASSYADYNNDRIIFYPTSGSAGSADFTAAFIPVDTAKVGALGNLKFEASNVKFSDA